MMGRSVRRDCCCSSSSVVVVPVLLLLLLLLCASFGVAVGSTAGNVYPFQLAILRNVFLLGLTEEWGQGI